MGKCRNAWWLSFICMSEHKNDLALVFKVLWSHHIWFQKHHKKYVVCTIYFTVKGSVNSRKFGKSHVIWNVWFQKISIPPPEGWWGQKAQEIPEGGGGEGGGWVLTVKLTSRWFSSIYYWPTAVVVRTLLLTDFGGTFWSWKGVCN